MSEGAQAWVTLATNDSYALGALVLARSLRRGNTTRQLAVMVTPGISDAMRGILSDVLDVVSEVNILDSEDTAHLALLERPELGITFNKIHCWKLTQFNKCVFLDADTLVIQNCDELFDSEEISAAPDAGWPDCFNSGVFVFSPSLETYRHVTEFALSNGSFDGGDQGLLNMYFRDWSQSDASRRLPFIYNMCASATYSYLPAYKVFGQNVKIVHFIGQEKPWLTFYDTATGVARPPSGQEHLQELLQAWWNIFRTEVHSRLSPQMGGGDNLSAIMVEQVQASFSQIFNPAESSVFSQFSFQTPPPYQSKPRPHSPPPPPPQEHHHDNNSQTEQVPSPPPPPQFLVAIQRYPPSHFWTPPPPPPPPIVYPSAPSPPPPHYSSPESSDSERNHQQSPPHTHDDNNQAQNSSAGCSGSPPQGNNISGNHSNGSQNDGPNEQSQQSSQPNREETRQNVKRKKRSKSKGIAGVYAQTAMEGDKSVDQLNYEDHMRKSAWEQGHIDYMGKDSFDNIMKKIQASMAQTSVQRQPPKSPTPQRKQSPPKQEAPPVPTPPPVVEPVVAEATKSASTQSSAETKATSTQAAVETQAAATQATETQSSAAPPPVFTPPETKATKAAADKARKEDRVALEERQAFERKLAEQKIAAEQKLEEEKQAAAARAAAAAAMAAAAAAKASSAAAAAASTSSQPKPEAPRAPVRKENTVLGNSVGVGLGLLGAAMVLVFAVYAAYSPTRRHRSNFVRSQFSKNQRVARLDGSSMMKCMESK